MTFCLCQATSSPDHPAAQREVEELARFVEQQRQSGVSETLIRSHVLALLSKIKLIAAVGERPTVVQACRFYKYARRTARKEHSGAIDFIEGYWPMTPLADIDDTEIRNFLAYLARAGVRDTFASLVMRCLKAIFSLISTTAGPLATPEILSRRTGWVLPAPVGPPTVGMACVDFCKKEEYGVRAHGAAERIAIYWKDTPLAEVDDQKIAEYIAWLQSGPRLEDNQIRLRLEDFRSVLGSKNYALPAEGEAFLERSDCPRFRIVGQRVVMPTPSTRSAYST